MSNNYLFSKNHIWVLNNNDNTVTIGITEYAAEKLGNIIFLNLPDKGDIIELDDRFGDIESIKTVSDLISPVSGKVIDINEELTDNPENINDLPYESWFVKLDVTKISDNLIKQNEYEEYVKTL